MTSLAELLPDGWEGVDLGEFEPNATYHPTMDCIIYLREAGSYRADRIDEFLTLLWHTHEDRAIGVKLKGGRFLFEKVQEMFAPLGRPLGDDDFMPLMSALGVALTLKFGEQITDSIEASRLPRKHRHTTASQVYAEAVQLVGNAKVEMRGSRLARAC